MLVNSFARRSNWFFFLSLLLTLGCSSLPAKDSPFDTIESLIGEDASSEVSEDAPPVTAVIVTSLGDIVLELDAAKAPITVDNFVKYVKNGHYNGTVFHRVIEKFMIQGGGFDEKLTEKKTLPPIKNEASISKLRNVKYAIAMARTSNPNSATSQFFINTVDNSERKPNYPLDYDFCPDRSGYCVFGIVKEGQEVVDAIAKVKTGSSKGMDDVPVEVVMISRIEIREPQK